MMHKSAASRWAMMGIASAAALVVMACAAWSAEGPRVVYPETRFVFPAVIEGNPVVHAFVVQNHGDATLDIKNVRTG